MLAVVLAAASGCVSVVRGAPEPGHLPPTKAIVITTTAQPAIITEDGADWAVANLTPCGLMGGPRLAAVLMSRPAPPKARRSERECEADVRLQDGAVRPLTVELAAEFVHVDRAVRLPIDVGGLSAYQALFEDSGTCDVDIPLSPTRSINISVFVGKPAATCAGARLGADDVAEYVRGPAVAAFGPLGFRQGERDSNLDLECQFINSATPEDCRVAQLVEVPSSVDGILGLPREVAAHVSCSMLDEPFRELTGRRIELAAYGTSCHGRTLDGAVTMSLGTFEFAKLDDYCYSFERTPITLSGHRTNVCGNSSDELRDMIIAAYPDPDRNGVLLAEIQLQPPRGILRREPDRTFDVMLLDRIVERILAERF